MKSLVRVTLSLFSLSLAASTGGCRTAHLGDHQGQTLLAAIHKQAVDKSAEAPGALDAVAAKNNLLRSRTPGGQAGGTQSTKLEGN